MGRALSEPTVLGICVGLVLGLLYLALCWRQKAEATFSKFAEVILACVGIVVSVRFGYIALSTPKEQLGPLSDQQLTMFLGALAIVWTAVDTLRKIYLPLATGASPRQES